MKVRTRVSLYEPPVQYVQKRPIHVGVQINGVRSKWESPVVIILRDTQGHPIFDTGYSVFTAPTLVSGILMNFFSGGAVTQGDRLNVNFILDQSRLS